MVPGHAEFEWDDAKSRANRAKHGISFEQAAAVLRTVEEQVTIYDAPHSLDEDRWITVARTGRFAMAVVWTDRGGVTRIISARKARAGEERLL